MSNRRNSMQAGSSSTGGVEESWSANIYPEMAEIGANQRISVVESPIIARNRSRWIDKLLHQDKVDWQKEIRTPKLLLLGQAESGKSTTLKHFKMLYAPSQFNSETRHWTFIILFNLVRSVNLILATLDYHEAFASSSDLPEIVQDDLDVSDESLHHNASVWSDGLDPEATSGKENGRRITLSDDIRWRRIQLAPLKQIELDIRNKLSANPSSSDPSVSSGSNRRQSHSDLSASLAPGMDPISRKKSLAEFAFRFRPSLSDTMNPEKDQEANRIWGVVHRCAADIQALWNDEGVRSILKLYPDCLGDHAYYFLDEAERVATPGYVPTQDDVLRARVRTNGAIQHKISEEGGPNKGKSWVITDLGGSRPQRKIWGQFFDNVHAIIFLAPVSVFDQRLEEDPSKYRLQDTFKLWEAICSKKELSKVHLILFLNKTDVLSAKLAQGKKFGKYVKSYKGPNEATAILRYLEDKFRLVHSQCSADHRRPLRVFRTSVIDRETTSAVLTKVQEAVLTNMLDVSNLSKPEIPLDNTTTSYTNSRDAIRSQ